MEIQLKPEQEKFIEEQVASGKYNYPEKLVDTMFQVFGNLQSEYGEWVKETRDQVDVAISEIERGESLDGEIVFARLRDKLRHARENKS